LEARWGLRTLEVPQSRVCDSEAFRWFVAHLLAEAGRFQEIYNQAVGEYRRAHRIRNLAHPVPDLAREGAWIESPLWIWTAEAPQRRRLFVRPDQGALVVSDRGAVEFRLPWWPGGDGAAAVRALAEANRQGVRIRSRALSTTLWARLALGDLFLHGIGGAKYDQVTDRLIERFFGLAPPAIQVLSATLYLPIVSPQETAAKLRTIRQSLRDLAFHADLIISSPPPPDAEKLVATKQKWIATPQTPENAYQRWRAFREINEALQPWAQRRRQELLSAEAAAMRAGRAEKILHWREYGFCLYPKKIVREFLDQLLPKNA
jgi:hypothetical protein